ncbi:DUF1294 domain-containing protein [Thermodesulfobacteriota bacterium]
MRLNPVSHFALAFFSIAVVLAVIIWRYVSPIGVGQAWLVSITLATFTAYGYDKIIAGSDWTRVPENVLLAVTFSGGTIGAIAGMMLFRHKTVSPRFRNKFWLVIVAQVLLVFIGYMWLRKAFY